MYALAMGYSIDVGKVLYYYIHRISRITTIGGLGHLSLIIELYRSDRLNIGSNEERMLPKSLITRASNLPHGADSRHGSHQIEAIGDDHGDHPEKPEGEPQGHPT